MYATQDDLAQRFGEVELIALTDRATPATGQVNATLVALAIVDASDEIDAYISAHYDVPLASIPPTLARICCDIARYRLAPSDGLVTDEMVTRYQAAVRFLEGIASGRIAFGVGPSSEPASVASPAFSLGQGRTLTLTTLEDL